MAPKRAKKKKCLPLRRVALLPFSQDIRQCREVLAALVHAWAGVTHQFTEFTAARQIFATLATTRDLRLVAWDVVRHRLLVRRAQLLHEHHALRARRIHVALVVRWMPAGTGNAARVVTLRWLRPTRHRGVHPGPLAAAVERLVGDVAAGRAGACVT